MQNKPIYVTMPALPPLDEFVHYLEGIWSRRVLTNQGPLHQEFEQLLAAYLEVPHLSLFSSGTAALVTALQALDLTGEVITTPFSFVATSNAIMWNGLTPVFVDIDPDTLNLDATQIEQAITPKTTAILAVHCYGYPCDTSEIGAIATRHGLKVIYDAAHAFGVRDGNGSILKHGDLSVVSFHATKVFNTFEGGAVICGSAELKSRLDQLKNFGLASETEMASPGLNGKMSEINAAMGLVQLRHINDAITARKVVDARYRAALANVRGIRCLEGSAKAPNFSYFPVLITDDFPISRDELHALLKEENIYARRYFYPLLCDLGAYSHLPSATGDFGVARPSSERIMCLPIYPDLAWHDVDRIVATIAKAAAV